MRVFLFFVFTFIVSEFVHAQPNWLWVNSEGGSLSDMVVNSCTDSEGNNYHTGFFTGSATIGGVSLNAASTFDQDIFVAKYDKNGNTVWVIRAGGSAHDNGRGIAVDTNGNVFVTGFYYSSSIIFGDTVNNAGGGGNDIFLMKVNSDGTAGWIDSYGNTGSDGGSSILIDQANNDIYLNGFFSNTVAFGGSNLSSAGNTDIIMMKLNASGTIQWAKKGGSSGADSQYDIKLDGNGYVYGLGYSEGGVTFGSLTASGYGGFDICLVKYSTSNGTESWVKVIGSNTNDAGFGMGVSSTGHISITGYFNGTVSFGATAGSVVSTGSTDIFIAQFDLSGNDIWVRSAGSSSSDGGRDIEVDKNDNIYITGTFFSTVTFGSLSSISSAGGADIFLVRYSDDGTAQFSIKCGGTSGETAGFVNIANDNRILLSGVYQGTAAFGSTNETSTGNNDIFFSALNVSYLWAGTTSSAWNLNTNWTPNGIPGEVDYVTIVNTSNQPLLNVTTSVTRFTITSGTLDLNTFILTSTDSSIYDGGSVNNGTMRSEGTSATYSGTTFGSVVETECESFLLNGSTFNNIAYFEKTGDSSDVSEGGNIFNDVTSFINSSNGDLILADTSADFFADSVYFTNSGTGDFFPANNGINTFEGNISSIGTIIMGNGDGVALLNGTGDQFITGSGNLIIRKLTNDKVSSNIFVSRPLTVSDSLTFGNGTESRIVNDTNLITLNDNIVVSGAGLTAFISGIVEKVGDDAFIFPIGKDTIYQPIAISAPAQPTDIFTAEYFHEAPPAFTTPNDSISGVSDCQYWYLTRDNGTSDVSISLLWNERTCTNITPAVVKVGRYSGSLWENVGANSIINSGASGSVTSDVLSVFGIITFGEDLCGGYRATLPLLHLTNPSNFLLFDSLTTSDKFMWTIDSIPTLSGLTDTLHTVVLQVAAWEADPETGAVPYWGNVLEFRTEYDPDTDPLIEGAYEKLIDDLIDQEEEGKTYFWRAGIQFLPEVGGVQPVSWSDINVFTVKAKDKAIPAAYLTTSHTNDINWVYEVTYLDENKTNQVISYIDGLGKTRQNQVLLNSSSMVMCTEVAYSEEAGSPVQTMVAPTDSSKFSYAHRFFDVKTGSDYSDFMTAHFDREIVGSGYNSIMTPAAVDTTAGVGNYYRNNSTYEDYVDDAKGYPYAYSVGYKDPLSRPMLTGGVGETFKITGGKEIQSYNTSPSYQELKRIYGKSKTDSLINISKSVTIDPNGVGSVTYTDAEGKVIATALSTCSSISSNLDELREDGMEGFTARYNVLSNDVLDNDNLQRTSSTNFFLSCPSTSVNIHYQIDQGVFSMGEGNCTNCKYNLNMRIVEDATGLEVFNKTKNLPEDTSQIACEAENTTFEFDTTISISRAGTYTVYRTLDLQKDVSGETVTEQIIYDYQQTLLSNIDSLRNVFENEYYGREEWYVMRELKSRERRPGELRRCLGEYIGSGSSVVNGLAASASVVQVTSMDIDDQDNIYFVDSSMIIRKITPEGVVSTVANLQFTNGNYILDLTTDGNGNVYFTTAFNSIKKLASSGTVSDIITGKNGARAIEFHNGYIYFVHRSDFSVDSINISKIDTTGSLVKSNYLSRGSELPLGVSAGGQSLVVNIGNENTEEIYMTRPGVFAVYKITSNSGVPEKIAGTTYGYENGSPDDAKFREALAITEDAEGNLIVSDYSTIRKVDKVTGFVSKVAGRDLWFSYQGGPLDSLNSLGSGCLDLVIRKNGEYFIADGSAIRKISVCGSSTTYCPEVLPAARLSFTDVLPVDITLHPNKIEGKDAFVASNTPSSNNGDHTQLVAKYITSSSITINSLLQFDLDTIPAGATILDARLSLYQDPITSTNGDNAAWLKRVTSSWTESAVTWSTKPSVTATNAVAIPASTNKSNLENLDVTNLIADIYANTNYGIEISLQNTGGGVLALASSDHYIASLRPKLQITYAFSGCSNLGSLSDYATVTLSAVPHSDTSASSVDIGQAVWDRGMTKEEFVSELVNSVNSDYGSNGKGFIAANAKGGNYFGESINTMTVSAEPGTGNTYNRWRLSATISYTSGIDTNCFRISLSPSSNEQAGVGFGAPHIFKGGFNEGQCNELRWYLDQVNVSDVIVNDTAKKEIADLDGMKTTDSSYKEHYIVEGLGTPVSASAALKDYFLENYERLHWVNIPPENILSMQSYPVTGSSNISIPEIQDNRFLDTTTLGDYILIKVKYKAPSCEDQCVAKEFSTDCQNSCTESIKAIDADIFYAYNQISDHNFGAYTAPDSKNYVDNSNTVRTLKYLLDNYYPWDNSLIAKVDSVSPDGVELYLAYETAVGTRTVFDFDACVRSCYGEFTSDDICKSCNLDFYGCNYENQTELSGGYEYFMNLWDEKGVYPYSSLDELQTEILDPETSSSYSPPQYRAIEEEISGLGTLLYNHLINNFQSDTVRANWMAIGGTCSNCATPGDTSYGCAAGTPLDVSELPVKVISILDSANLSCVSEYSQCLLKANDFEYYQCKQNRDFCLLMAADGSDSTNCETIYNCEVATAGTDTLQRIALIRSTVQKLYINTTTIDTLSTSLYQTTVDMKLPDLIFHLMDYEIQERCRLECAGYFEIAYDEWIENKIDSARVSVINSFSSQCYNRDEQMEVNFIQNVYHYTLYEYNNANQLIATIPPEGIDYVDIEDSDSADANRTPQHRMHTRYTSNSLGQLKVAFTPDGDSTQYLYDKAGRVRFSQTKEQKVRGAAEDKLVFSYTKYDSETGRIMEVGEYNYGLDPDGMGFINPDTAIVDSVYASDKVDDFSWPDDAVRTHDESRFFYDTASLCVACSYGQARTQRNLDNRVSKVSNANASTYYSYDRHGRVEWVAQELLDIDTNSLSLSDSLYAALSLKTVDYRYLPVTSQVQQVIYQKGRPAEEFRHRYSYDSDNRLTMVEVSRDTVTWNKAAAYDYYLHGPLKSTGLGDSIQKLDYVYNIQGWLKSINHPLATSSLSLSDSLYSLDVFGMALHYYSGDYSRTGKQLDATASITPQSGSHIKDKGKDLYNGNISAWTTYTGFDQTSASGIDPLMAQGFRYDKLNRLVSSFTETKVISGFSGWTASGTSLPDIFQENLKYDANGNIDTLIRTCGNVSNVAMDNMLYHYPSTVTDYYGQTKKTNNKLGYIDDDTDLTAVDDITDQASGNYQYDAKGRLIKDFDNEIDSIIWTPYDKVKEVIRTVSSTKARLQFTYDAMGRRISKKAIRSTTDSTQNTVTYYAYDASGNVMAVYEKTFTDQTEYKYSVTEEYIYGSSRVGSYNNGNTVFDTDDATPDYVDTLTTASLRYELTDHLGNVRAVVAGTRTAIDNEGSNQVTNPTFDSHSSGLGTDWQWQGTNIGDPSIVTGNGFSGNAQRVEIAAGKTRAILKNLFTVESGKQYRITFNYRSNKSFKMTGNTALSNGFTQTLIPANTGTATTVTYTKTSDGNEVGIFFDMFNMLEDDWFEIDDVEVVKLEGDGTPEYYLSDIVFLRDYYPFGSEMPGRKFTASGGEYRYGFNGMEKTDEVYGDGNEYTTEFRQYDSRVGRWMSLDPLMNMFSDVSPFSFVNNNPISLTDPYGLAPGDGDIVQVGGEGSFDSNGDGKIFWYESVLELSEVAIIPQERPWWESVGDELSKVGRGLWETTKMAGSLATGFTDQFNDNILLVTEGRRFNTHTAYPVLYERGRMAGNMASLIWAPVEFTGGLVAGVVGVLGTPGTGGLSLSVTVVGGVLMTHSILVAKTAVANMSDISDNNDKNVHNGNKGSSNNGGSKKPTPDTNPDDFTKLKGDQGYVHKKTGEIYKKSYTSHGNKNNTGKQWKVYPKGTKDFSKQTGNRTTIDEEGNIIGD